MRKVLMFPSRPAPALINEMRACEDDMQDLNDPYEIDDLHRQYTLLLLRRYFRMSVEMGRLPSVLGRKEFFRAKVSSYKICTFEDAVIFVHDMERSLEKLDETSRRLIAGLVFLEYSRSEVADALGIYRTTVAKRFDEALNSLARVLLRLRLINPAELRKAAARRHGGNLPRVYELPLKKRNIAEACQESFAVEFSANLGGERK